MKYVKSLKEIIQQPTRVRNIAHKYPIVLFLMKDNRNSNPGLNDNPSYQYVFALEPSEEYRPESPLIIGMRNGEFGTLDPNMDPDTFKRKPILESALSNQFAFYLVQELNFCPEDDKSHLENMVLTMGDYLVKRYCMQNELECNLKMGLTPFQIQKIKRYVHDHIDRPVRTSELARHVRLSTHHFIRVFKKTTGETPQQYTTRIKLEQARRLLLSTQDSIIQVGMGIGCDNPSHFSQLFKSNFGITPMKYRKTYQENMLCA